MAPAAADAVSVPGAALLFFAHSADYSSAERLTRPKNLMNRLGLPTGAMTTPVLVSGGGLGAACACRCAVCACRKQNMVGVRVLMKPAGRRKGLKARKRMLSAA